MKKLHIFFFVGLTILGTACSDYLDINTNPNKPTSVTPDLILPQALKQTADVMNYYNTYGQQLGGYAANAGGYGGFGSTITYAYSSSDYAAAWSAVYDNLDDYQYIINNSDAATGGAKYRYFRGVAQIMKANAYSLLVDAYNDVPYSEALLGAANLTPKYDDAAAIYGSLATLLDSGIMNIDGASAHLAAVPGSVQLLGTTDVVFGKYAGAGSPDLKLWKQLANTLKLRLMVRGNGKVTFANTTFSADGFLTTDAMINPGYSRDNQKQNPEWNTWAFTYTGAAGNKAWMPSKWILSFYNGGKLVDPKRGAAIYYQFPATGANQLGYENVGVPSSPTGSNWYSSTNRVGTAAGSTVGVLKGPDAGYPLVTAFESYFLQAEASLKAIITSSMTTQQLFEAGITASFTYLYTLPNLNVSGTPAADAAAYIAANASDPRVNFAAANTPDQQLEAIITQKYIAHNMVNSQQGWWDYLRTGYPIVAHHSTDPIATFASLVSQSKKDDGLPSRLQYPNSEVTYNPLNVPANISSSTSKIFWAQ